MQILEELYLGGVRPGERTGKRNTQYNKALDEAIKTSDALIATLTDEQKELFEAFIPSNSVRSEMPHFSCAFPWAAICRASILWPVIPSPRRF